MWDDARRSAGSDDDLLRQAYLLTGDPDRAERLARQAVAAAAQHARRAGPAGSDEVARTELVRAVLAEAEPGDHPRSPLPPGRHAPAWAALGGLPARRRAVLVLRYAEGLPDERIADRVGTTPRSVHVDAEAGLLTLGPALAGDRDPGRLVAAALADAGRRWAGMRRPRAAGAAARPVDTWVPAPLDAADGHDWWSRTGPGSVPGHDTGAAPGVAPGTGRLAGGPGDDAPTSGRPDPGGRTPHPGLESRSWDITERREAGAPGRG